MRLRIGLCVTVAALAAAPASAAATRLPTGSNPYLRIVHVREGGETVVLTRLLRHVMGIPRSRVATAECERLVASPVGDAPGPLSSGLNGREGPHSRFVSLIDRHADLCSVWAVRPGEVGNAPDNTPPDASIALTQRGAAFLDEDHRVAEMVGLLALRGFAVTSDHFPATSLFTARLPRVVALADPEATPPAAKVGVYSDGAHHLTLVMLSALGRRLSIDLDNGVETDDVPFHLAQAYGGASDAYAYFLASGTLPM